MLTLVIHITPLYFLWHVKHQDKKEPVPIKLLTADKESEDFKFRKSSDNSYTPCDNSYRGVGFRGVSDGVVTEVAPGSPAERAGMQIADIVTNYEIFGSDRYPVGTPLDAIVLRGEKIITMHMIVENICQEK